MTTIKTNKLKIQERFDMVIAYHGEEKLKTAVISRLAEHRRMDRIAQGVYWDNGRGCLLGCLTHDNENSHESAELLFGIELRVGYWLESVFEGLPKEQCEWWVLASAEAIPTGADLSMCHHELALWLLAESGLLHITDGNRDAIQQVAGLHRRAITGGIPSDNEWFAAESSAADSAVRSARSAAGFAARSAWSAAGSAAESTAESARSAAGSAELSAWSAAWSALSAADSARSAADSARSAADSARSAADSAAWSAAWKKIANKSLEIFSNAPVSQQPTDCSECVRDAWKILETEGVADVILGK